MDTNTFGTGIRNLRLKAGMTQQALAEMLGIERSKVNNWEHQTASGKDYDRVLLALRAQAVQAIREKMHMNRAAFGRVLGFSATHIRRLETAVTPITYARLQWIKATFRNRKPL